MPRYLKIIFSLMIAVYLVVALTVTAGESGPETCTGMTITVNDPSESGFVTPGELARELDNLPSRAKGLNLGSINTQSLRRRLLDLDKIEDAEVVRYTDGSIRITATPIIPVARIFGTDGSYYINREGKRVKASARYHKNVPLICGDFDRADSTFSPLDLLPLVNYIAADSVWNNFISMISVKSPNDIILVPVIREHVINIGAPTDFDSKFNRLGRFYREVLPLQGWEKYDTLTVKWSGQLVATKRHRRPAVVETARYEEDETVDTGTMLAGDDVAPGQTIPGVKAHSETPIPATQRKTPAAPKTTSDKSPLNKKHPLSNGRENNNRS
ncbi:MAG: hypothetical protein HFJ91_05815 [Muribaculaceae bacterium]|nr:hypothetical protein [Muribaculaceae bacterium]